MNEWRRDETIVGMATKGREEGRNQPTNLPDSDRTNSSESRILFFYNILQQMDGKLGKRFDGHLVRGTFSSQNNDLVAWSW